MKTSLQGPVPSIFRSPVCSGSRGLSSPEQGGVPSGSPQLPNRGQRGRGGGTECGRFERKTGLRDRSGPGTE